MGKTWDSGLLPLPCRKSLSNSYRVCQTLDHFPDPLFSFEDTSAPLPQNPTFIDYNNLDLEIPTHPHLTPILTLPLTLLFHRQYRRVQRV